jgi:hypothetical protein
LESNSGIRIGVRVAVLAECIVDTVDLNHRVGGLGADALVRWGLATADVASIAVTANAVIKAFMTKSSP